MGGHVLIRRVEVGFVPAGMGHTDFGIIRHHDGGNGAHELEGADVQAHPGGEVLGEDGFGVGIVARAQGGDEEIGGAYRSGPGVVDRDRVPCKIDEEFFSRLVVLA
ncbi:MAG: hypothetical protein A4E58_01546 [Syntrophorhabdus sp. PtaB.Bin006]|nr:MAG: hypothetical protein A4E58_01546 [Syntrophorhabdus sp. PtaB.Bin006]